MDVLLQQWLALALRVRTGHGFALSSPKSCKLMPTVPQMVQIYCKLTGDLDKQFGDPPPCFFLGSCVVSKNLPVLVTIVFEAERVQPKILSPVSNSMDLTTIMSYTHKFSFVS